jgi:allantoicase
MPDFTELVDLAAERLGGAVVWANDEWFAEKENLLVPGPAVFVDGKYTARGKWMDGWETRRRRAPGHDACIVRLGLPGVVHGVVVDTSFFKGNYPLECSIDAREAPEGVAVDDLASDDAAWRAILPKTKLQGDAKNALAITGAARCTHIRLNIFPDGGVARLRVHGEALPHPRFMGKRGAEIDLASLENGATVPSASDMFFGSRNNLILPGRGLHMGDGWETRRSGRVSTETDRHRVREADWALVRLAGEGVIERVEIDTTHFKGNAPDRAAIEVAASEGGPWTEIVPVMKLQPDTRHHVDTVAARVPARFARVLVWPDGGVMRLRLWGALTPAGREACGLAHVNAMSDDAATRALLACCGSTAWAKQMTSRRPFASLAAMREANAAVWAKVGESDVDQAFRAHPRIGEKKAAESAGAQARAWSEGEQRGAAQASQATLDELARVNAEYEKKFGHLFIVCATGRSADEMLALAEARMANDAATEKRVAAEEQRKITDLRLEKLVLR